MGASVNCYWPGISDRHRDGDPGFFNDCKAWGDWMAERAQNEALINLHQELGVGAVLTFTTDGVDDDEVDWVTPDELEAAALRLREMVLANDPKVRPILDGYESCCRGDDVAADFAQDLKDVAAIAAYARRCKAGKMTLEVNW